MLPIAMLILVACAGAIYAAFLLKRDREGRVADLIHGLEREAGLTRDAAEATERGRLAGRLRRFMPAAVMESYAEKLLWAGRPYGLDAGQFAGLKLVAAFSLPLLTLLRLSAYTPLLMLMMGIVGFVLPDLWLNGKVAERRRQVEEELPLFADLVATALSAGLSLTEAVRRVAADAPGLVAREFLRGVQEMAAGKPRIQAWRDLLDRLPGDELRTIVNAIMQAEQYGTSVAEILRYQVQQIRMFKGAIHSGKTVVELVRGGRYERTG